MVWIFRLLFLLLFALFWGGLTFYTGFVVRISHDVLDDPMQGGLITQRVTAVLQYLGAATVAFMFCNAFVVARRLKKCGFALFAIAILLSVVLIGLFTVHGHLDSVIDISGSEVTNYDVFEISHRRYNQLTTIEWLSTLAYLAITVFSWRSIDLATNDNQSG